MKKRLVSLFLAFLTLFLACALSACEEKYGEFYTDENGILQNTLIECVVTKTGANQITYEIRNTTPYSIWIKAVALHVCQDGEWEELLVNGGHIWVDRDLLGGWQGHYKEVYERKINVDLAIHPGEYRIVVEMEAKKNRNFDEIEKFYATACFTITDEIYGIFETKDGILQNTLVTAQTPDRDLIAPVVDFGVYLKNDSAFNVEQQRYSAEHNYNYLLEILANGAWQEAPSFGEIVYEEVTRKDFWKKEQMKSGAAALMDKRYIALEPGEYRVRIKYTATCGVDGVEIPEGQLEAVAYFTVTAPVQ
jgi:hypothetical protein